MCGVCVCVCVCGVCGVCVCVCLVVVVVEAYLIAYICIPLSACPLWHKKQHTIKKKEKKAESSVLLFHLLQLPLSLSLYIHICKRVYCGCSGP